MIKKLQALWGGVLVILTLLTCPDLVKAEAVPLGVPPAKIKPASRSQQPVTGGQGTVMKPAFVYVPATPAPPVGLGRRLLWYVPNRCMDLLDIFRFRVRLGPGFAAGFRLTDYGAFYYGQYSSVYLGLPGPRNPRYVRWPVGYESLTGIVLGGVDATDDTPHGPEYGPAEVDAGVQAGIIGIETGIDPMEIADFFTGFLMLDLEHDDYPRPRGPEPRTTSGVSPLSNRGIFQVGAKPATFSGLDERLDYLHTNVQTRVSNPVRSTDEFFAKDERQRLEVPDSRIRLGIYSEMVRGKSMKISLQPDAEIDVRVPNIENRLNLFIQSATADDLPGRTMSEMEDRGLTLGVRKYLRESSISFDAGIHTSWLPSLYGRVTWHPKYNFGQWSLRPEQRFFVDTTDKLGSLSTLYVDRWLGGSREFYAGSISSAHYTQKDEAMSWQQTFRVGRVRQMLDGQGRVSTFARRDVASGGDIAFTVFGKDSEVDTYRFTVGIRRPWYQEWIFWDVEPGIEWSRENDFDTAFRLTVGVDMLFWGPGQK